MVSAMTDALTTENPALSDSETAAILLMLLGDAEAAQVLNNLEPHEVQHIGRAMFNVADVSRENVESVLSQFTRRARVRTSIGFGSASRIRAVMQHALGVDRADTVLARITPPTRSQTLDALRWIDSRTIVALIEHEHPQIAALVLAHLEPPIAADVLQLLPADSQADILHRVASLGSVSAEALADLEEILLHEMARIATAPATSRGGASDAAKIMNNTRPGNDQRIIKALAKIDKPLAAKIEDEMFIFADLGGLDDKNMGVLLRGVETSVLVVALKGAAAPLRDRMLGCMSSRAADSIRDEMAERGPIRLAEVIDAQKEMLTIARRLADSGTLMLSGRGDDYV